MTNSIELHEDPEGWFGAGRRRPATDDAGDLVERVIAADSQSESEIDLALTWRELVQGTSTVIGSFFTPERCGLILAPTDSPRDPPLSGRRLEILESILCGVSQNSVGIDLRLAPSTVALNARQALESLGVSGLPSRVHPLLMLAATAGRHHTLAAASLSFVPSPLGDVQVIGIPRPGLRLAGVLPAAELDVVSMFVEGACHAEIAERRGTAQRTVANQLAAVFKRLRVSGRSELLQRLFALDGVGQPAPAADSTPPPPSRPPTVPPPSTVRYPRPVPLSSLANDSRTSGVRMVSSLSAPLQALAASRGG